MFTGLVEDVGRVERAERRASALTLTIAPSGFDAAALAIGESVAVDGACLTVVAREAGRFQVEVGPESLERTTLGELRAGSPVNLERALALGDRLGGHLVAGHVDAVGTVRGRRPRGPAVDLEIAAPPEALRYVVAKGSIAIDGVSLTVNTVGGASFSVSLIPHTQERTALADKQVGRRVNLEADLVGKYVEKLCAPYAPGSVRPEAEHS